ncbi:response regulator transcription factor [Cellulosilyticum sp. I15G10I2]|uniref:response regulator transcription factor n=1 Tax=Cellulosilyticum sp. I15G10I2 TaxID=1892843 RepID=UPI00085CB3CF|nr:response regulator [Cellulosilyticum sp. I15G10I2]
MIRVMIVEDEPPIMRVITKFIEAFSDEFQVVGTAINGKKAIELLETEEIDVVFTDIKMPVMDGLELTERIRVQKPETIVVIISGFQDFEYARKALQFQVYDYLLKPIAPDAINTVLSKIEKEVFIRDKQKQRQKIMSLINEKHVEEKDIIEQTGYAVFLICVGAFPLIPNDSMLPAKSVWDQMDMEKRLASILLEEENSMFFNGKTAAEMVVVFEVKDKKRIVEAADQLACAFKTDSYLPMTLAATQNIVKLNDIGQVLEALRARLYISIKLFTSQTIWLNVKEEQEHVNLDTQLIAETIRSAAQLGGEQLRNCILTTLVKFSEVNLTQLQIVAFFYDTISSLYFKQDQAGKDTSSLKMDLDTAISNTVDNKSLAKDIAFIILGTNEQDTAFNDKNNIPDIAQKIEEYLQLNYKQSITTNMLSKKFGFVPSYISKLFRAYKGMSPSEYLTYYRIEKSKQIMLNQPDILCKEVATMVGFSDQYHFSKTFKKQAGMWPTEYVIKK